MVVGLNNENEGSFLSKIKRAIKSRLNFLKNKNMLIVVLSIIIIIIFASVFLPHKQKTSDSTNLEKGTCSAESYCKNVENRLINILENVKGIGSVKVFVVVDSSPEIRYLEETTKTNNSNNNNSSETIQTTIVLAKNGSITSPVVVVEKLPKITGVLIVASGAKDIKLKTTLINVVSSVLSVDISKVEVLEGKE